MGCSSRRTIGEKPALRPGRGVTALGGCRAEASCTTPGPHCWTSKPTSRAAADSASDPLVLGCCVWEDHVHPCWGDVKCEPFHLRGRSMLVPEIMAK